MIVDKKTFDMTWGVKDSAKWENRGLGVPTTAKGIQEIESFFFRLLKNTGSCRGHVWKNYLTEV